MEKTLKAGKKQDWHLTKGQTRVLRDTGGVYTAEGFHKIQSRRVRKDDGMVMGQVGIRGGMVTVELQQWTVNGEPEEVAVAKYDSRILFAPLPLESKGEALAWKRHGFDASLKPKEWARKMKWRGWEAWDAAALVREKWLLLMSGLCPLDVAERLEGVVQFPGDGEPLGFPPTRMDTFKADISAAMKQDGPESVAIREMIRAETLAAVADAMAAKEGGFDEAIQRAMDAADRAEIAADLAKSLRDALGEWEV